MQRLSSRIWPLGWHAGGLGWWLGRQAGEGSGEAAVFRSRGVLLGWAARDDGHEATVDVDPARRDAADALVRWLGHRPVFAAAANKALVRALRGAGFTAGTPWVGLWREAARIEPELPPGYALRPVRPDELGARVECHRAAWLPAALPYHPDHRPELRPGATSSFTEAMYDRVRATWLYEESLDLVVEAPDGTLAGCCIGWFDPATGVTEIEPLGVVPEHRRRGLAGALCCAVAARSAQLGGREVFINTGPQEAYPAPAAAYLKAGFRVVERGVAYRFQAARTM